MPETTSAPPPPGLRDRPKARAEAVNTGEPVRVNAPPHPRWPSGRPQASCRPKSVKTAGRSTPPRHPPPPPGTKSRTHVTHSVKPAQNMPLKPPKEMPPSARRRSEKFGARRHAMPPAHAGSDVKQLGELAVVSLAPDVTFCLSGPPKFAGPTTYKPAAPSPTCCPPWALLLPPCCA